MVIDTEQSEARWSRVEYDVAETQAAMRARRLPDRLVERLAYGL